MNTLEIARICHEANRVLTEHFQDVPLQPGWDAAPNEMRVSSAAGVEWRLAHRGAPAAAQHEQWMKDKLTAGWTLGPMRDADLKTHPALVPYEKLPVEVQLKDKLFTAIVLAAG
ncbi:MAG: RyR domain-containing protein [Phycisphaerae bacterium]